MSKAASFTHSLVRALSPLEKTYIKKQFKKNELHLAILLDDLYKTAPCSNKAFKKKYAEKRYAKNLTQNKNYLRRKIIDVLIKYQEKNIPEVEKRHQLNIISVLIQKGFLKKTKQLINTLLEKALQYEEFTTCYDLTVTLCNIYSNNVSFSLSAKEIKKYASDRRFYLDQLNKLEKLASLNDIHLTTMPEKEKIQALTAQLKALNLEGEDLPEDYPYTAKRIFYFTKSQLSKLKKQDDQGVFYLSKLIELYQSYPQLIEKDYTIFLIDCINYLNNILYNSNYKLFFIEHKKIMNEIAKLEHSSHLVDNSRLYVLQYLFPQFAYNNSGQIEEALAFTTAYLQFLEDHQKELSTQYFEASIIQISIALLYDEQFEKILDLTEPHVKSKIYSHQYTIRILQILCHHYLNNQLLIEHLFNSFIHYLKTVDQKDKIKGIHQLKKYIENKSLTKMKDQILEDFVWIQWQLLE